MDDSYYSSDSYFHANENMHANDSLAKAKILSEIIEGCIKIPRDKPFTILEIGGGAGLVSYYMCEMLLQKNIFQNSNSFVLHSLEPSLESINLQKKNNHYISTFYNGSLGEYSIPNNSYRLI